MKLKELVRHLSTSEGDCPLSTVECPYSIFNCTFVGLRQNIEAHLAQSSVYHAQIQLLKAFDVVKGVQQDLIKCIAILNEFTDRRLEGLEMNIGDHSEGRIGLDSNLSTSADQELRLQLLERTTYNGILLWKIDDFSRRRSEAVEGATPSLLSTPFYTSRHGYKMCARVYLNGDSQWKGTHLSVFFVIMRGPVDALLTWPFKQKVMLTLINQVGKKHITDYLRPDPTSGSFQRPGQNEMNIATGCPMFVRIDHLLSGGDVKDDTVFFKIVVDPPRVVP